MLSSCGVRKNPGAGSLSRRTQWRCCDSHRLHLLRERVRRHRARSSFSSEDLQCDLPLGSLRIPSPRPSGNMVVDPSDGLTPDGTDAHMLRDLELNRERVKLHRARQVSFSVSPQPVSSSNDSYSISRSDVMRSRDRDRQYLSRERRTVSDPTRSLYLPKHQEKAVHKFLDRVRELADDVNECVVCMERYHGMAVVENVCARCQSESEGHRYDAGNFAVNAKFCRPAVGPQPRFPGLPSHFFPHLTFAMKKAIPLNPNESALRRTHHY
ncbi:hypothetical protein BJV77DRAFT_1160792 [Russula vinacea]|nr:hypothetical protein BJV77DRAFT_1160792 [Russula vinacea]